MQHELNTISRPRPGKCGRHTVIGSQAVSTAFSVTETLVTGCSAPARDAQYPHYWTRLAAPLGKSNGNRMTDESHCLGRKVLNARIRPPNAVNATYGHFPRYQSEEFDIRAIYAPWPPRGLHDCRYRLCDRDARLHRAAFTEHTLETRPPPAEQESTLSPQPNHRSNSLALLLAPVRFFKKGFTGFNVEKMSLTYVDIEFHRLSGLHPGVRE